MRHAFALLTLAACSPTPALVTDAGSVTDSPSADVTLDAALDASTPRDVVRVEGGACIPACSSGQSCVDGVCEGDAAVGDASADAVAADAGDRRDAGDGSLDDSGAVLDARPPPQCVPGMQILCGCPGGAAGVQICADDGRYGRCDCPDAGVHDSGSDAPAALDVPPPCSGGGIRCAGSCVDLGNDRFNCGACARQCPAGESCRSGFCQPFFIDGGAHEQCDGGLSRCPGSGLGTSCIDPQTDSRHCGGCLRQCPEGTVCGQGACVTPLGPSRDQ